MRGDDTERLRVVITFEDGFGQGTAQGGLGTAAEFVDQEQRLGVEVLIHCLKVLQMRAVGTQVVVYGLFVADVDEDAFEDAHIGGAHHGDGQSALHHIL